MNYKQKLTILFFIIIFWINFYISWVYSVVNLVFLIAFYAILIYPLYWIYKKIIINDFIFFSRKNYKIFLREFLYRIASLFTLLLIFIWSFSIYQNEINPSRMATYTITNWDKIIVFQTMSHIWTSGFYNKVKENIKKLKENWYVLYFEWVRPGSEENHEAFNKALWLQLDKDTYSNMSKLYWLESQNNEIFLNQVNDKDYNIDVSIDDIIQEYKKLKIKNNVENRTYNEPLDANKLIVEELSKLNEKEKIILRYINKSFVNMIVKSENLQTLIQNEFANKELFDVILNKRNEVVAKKIISSEDKKIVMTYWMLHFNWILNILKENDIRWHITKIDYLYPLK